MIKRIFIGLLLTAVSAVTQADTFSLFSPATGLLVGDSSTYITTAASSSNIRSLWSGTCNTSSFLRGDGACTQVGVAAGGTGATSLTGVLKGNGTSAFTAAASSDVISLWSGTCSSSTYLRGDGACQTPGGGGGGSPGGSTGDLQYNNAGAFGGTTGVQYSGSGTLSLTNIFATGDFEVEGSVFTNGFSSSTATVGGQSVCLEDGTDCPGGSGFAPYIVDVGTAPNGCNALRFGDSVTSTVLNVITSDECSPPGSLGYDVVQIGGSTRLQIGSSSSNATIVNGYNEKIFFSGNIGGYGSSGSSCGTFSPSFLTCERVGTGAYEVTFPGVEVAEPICTANPSAIASTIGLGYDGIVIDVIADTPVDDYVVTFRAYTSPGEGLEATDLNIKYTCIGFYN